jgi:hypothetical protein
VAIGGNNTGAINTGRQTSIHTGGGTYVGGNVSVQGGDFVGRDKVTHGTATTDLAIVFATLLATLDKQAEPGAKALATEQVAAIQTEVTQPPAQRNDERLARMVDGLVDLVPSAVGAVVSAFASPLLGAVAGPATAAVLAQFKKP